MDTDEVESLLKDAGQIILSSSEDGQPYTRTIDAVYRNGKLLFIADDRSRKIAQFTANPKAAFTMVPAGPVPIVRSNCATVAPSDGDLDEVKREIADRHMHSERLIDAFGEHAALYEISFPSVQVFFLGHEEQVDMA